MIWNSQTNTGNVTVFVIRQYGGSHLGPKHFKIVELVQKAISELGSP